MASSATQEGRSEPSFWSILAQKAKSVLVDDDSLTTVNDLPAKTRSQQTPKDETSVIEQQVELLYFMIVKCCNLLFQDRSFIR